MKFEDFMTLIVSKLNLSENFNQMYQGLRNMINRRLFFKSLALAVISISFQSKKSIAQPKDLQQFQWKVPIVHFETVKNELSFAGEIKEDRDAKGIWLFIFVGTVLITDLAKAILALRREVVHGGVVIDTRKDKINIDTDKSLSGGVIIIKSSKGMQLYERDEINNASELVSAINKEL